MHAHAQGQSTERAPEAEADGDLCFAKSALAASTVIRGAAAPDAARTSARSLDIKHTHTGEAVHIHCAHTLSACIVHVMVLVLCYPPSQAFASTHAGIHSGHVFEI